MSCALALPELRRIAVSLSPAEHLERKSHGYSFIFALACFALTLLVFSAFFTPVSIGSGGDNESLIVGP
jgi:hypothetical protein